MTIMNSDNPETNSADSDADVEDEQDEETPETANAGWADSVSKILHMNKPKKKRTIVLLKAKKITDIKPTKTVSAGFQIATVEGEIKEEKIEITEPTTSTQTLEEPARKRKRDLPNLRVKPNILQKDRERTLTKIATKGVVQLFNAVKTQQKDISTKLKEAGPLEVRQEKVLKSIDKRKFLNVLMGEKSEIVDNEEPIKDESTWSVLRDDFMMDAKLKDWDKAVETEENDDEIVESA